MVTMSNIWKWRCAFLEKIGYTYDRMIELGYGWPIVQLNLKYVKPAFFRQKIRVNLALVEYETCMRIDYTIIDIVSGKKLTTGSTTQVAVDLKTHEMQFQSPPCWRSAVENCDDFTPAPHV